MIMDLIPTTAADPKLFFNSGPVKRWLQNFDKFDSHLKLLQSCKVKCYNNTKSQAKPNFAKLNLILQNFISREYVLDEK